MWRAFLNGILFMEIKVIKSDLEKILPLRNLFLQENNCQIRYNACHERNWSDSYLIKINNEIIGYASIKGKEDYIKDRDAIFEFYIIPKFRNKATLIFLELIKISKPKYIECQSNIVLLPEMLFEFSKNINADTILFEDNPNLGGNLPSDKQGFKLPPKFTDVIFRKRETGELIIGKKEKDMGSYILDNEGEIIATGGFLTHYNFPFVDLFMEVKKSHWREGLGSYILREIKKECYEMGRIPAARCHINNKASKATLLKAGFKICGFMLNGEISNPS